MQEMKILPLHNEITVTTADLSGEVDLAPYINVGKSEVKAFLFASKNALTSDEQEPATTTDTTLGYTIQESETTASSDFGDAVATFTSLAFTTDLSEAFEELHFVPTKRYVRGVADIAGTTPALALSSGIVAVKRFTT